MFCVYDSNIFFTGVNPVRPPAYGTFFHNRFLDLSLIS
jgi:hypothetical protein